MTLTQLANLCWTLGLAVALIGVGALWWDIKGRKED